MPSDCSPLRILRLRHARIRRRRPRRLSNGGLPGNRETKPVEDPRLLKAIHDAVVTEACRWRGIPKPTACGEFVRITDIWRYARVAAAEVRKFDAGKGS